jgi:hypothetical protein
MVDKVYLFNKQLFIVYFYVGDFMWDLLFTLSIAKEVHKKVNTSI